VRPPTIAIDLDGTLYKQDKWNRKTLGNLLPGAMEQLELFKAAGWDIVIHTARLPCDFPDVKDILKKDKVPYDKLWEGVGKPLADVYLDDRGVTFKGNWEGMFDKINEWNPWYGDKFLRPPPGSEDEQLCKSR